ncbi:Ankyrin repeat-containing domain protein [Fusarium austroafricanum]|uniref:Ankyrin repeat-containing domain protein n=1 Tax=Fusarium austroafricanum TaxID=2364996 RepID=A0A8H4K402_9HYPO|nr:Ankyrin repeat-containing domain protein [Fusarium austroafricanum]
MAQTSTYSNNAYTVGWISALKDEQRVAMAMLDSDHGFPQYTPGEDNNSYYLGEINGHFVAMACLSGDDSGIGAAAAVAKDMSRTFTNIRLVLLAGIGGGVPTEKDIRLGDVVVSYPKKLDDGGYHGVVQYDHAKLLSGDDFHRKELSSGPNKKLISAVDMLETLHELGPRFAYPDPKTTPDRLYQKQFIHKPGVQVCDLKSCPPENLVQTRTQRESPHIPEIHAGIIASGSLVIKNSDHRDKINDRYKKTILCVEMEAAGLMQSYPALVIRGISDYADSHKNDEWRDRAIAVACGYGKLILETIAPETVKDLDPIADRHRKDVSAWISTLSFASRLNDAVRSRLSNTGNWFLNDKVFQRWKDGSARSLFCHGIAGAGKTVMAGAIIQYLQSLNGTDKKKPAVVYVFCHHKEHVTARELVAALLKQLAEKMSGHENELEDLYKVHSEQHTLPTSVDMIAVMKVMANKFSKIFVVIDALDEMGEGDRAKLEFLQSVKLIGGFANVLVTSRRFPLLESAFGGDDSLEIRAQDDDVQRFIMTEIKKAPYLQKFISEDPELQNLILERTLHKSDGMSRRFLVASLIMLSLVDTSSRRDLKEALDELPSEIGDMYELSMDRVKVQSLNNFELACQVLCWVTYALRPIQTEELCHALAVRQGDTSLDFEGLREISHLVSICKGLVIVEEESMIVRLVHETAEKYFREEGVQYVKAANMLIASTCLRYLCFEVFDSERYKDVREMEACLKDYALLPYAAKNWGHHARHLKEDGEISELAITALKKRGGIADAMKLLSPSTGKGDSLDYCSGSPLHQAAQFGLEKVLRLLMDPNDLDVNGRDGHGRTPLWLAASRGYGSVIRLLFEHDADPNLGDRSWLTPLGLAARNGDRNAVQILLDNHAHATVQDDSGRSIVLHAMDTRWEHNRSVFEDSIPFIADEKSKTNIDGSSEISSLEDSVRAKIAVMLIHKGADINVPDIDKITPLFLASRWGYKATAQLLLDHKAIVDFKDERGSTPLWQACRGGHEPLVALLLDYGAYIDIRDHSGRSALWISSHMGQVEVVKTLIKRGANIEACDYRSRTPLSQAVANNHFDVVVALLSAGARTDFVDHRGHTILWQAARNSFSRIVNLLLEQGANKYVAEIGLLIFYILSHVDVKVTRTLGQIVMESVNQNIFHQKSDVYWDDATDRDPPSQGELCEDCASIMLHQAGSYRTHQICGISNSCPSCTFIARNFDELGFIKSLPLQLSQITFLRTPSLVLSDEQKCVVLQGLDGTTNPWQLKSPQACTESTVRSYAAAAARRWLDICINQHPRSHNPRCSPPVDSVLPKRVLDLGQTDSPTITLKETHSSERGHYICLSYCWGPSPFISTTIENLEQYKKGISISNLPKAFRDAIEITRGLKVQYLWIDALCIIQQHGEGGKAGAAHADWNEEISKMSDIYYNSYLTLAPLWANSVEDGLLSDQPQGEPLGGLVAMHKMKHFPRKATPEDALPDFPLLTRGWVYQERMLSPRTLYFGRQELLWECLYGRTCECGYATYRLQEVDKGEFHDHIKETPSRNLDTKLDLLWREMIIQYSHLRLTYSSDKLPALSGLAEAIRRKTGQHYLAGLWRDTLLLDMCWFSTSNEPQDRQWRAPSWSWASVNGSIEYEQYLYCWPYLSSNNFRTWARVLGADCSLKDTSPTGQITDGFIRLECSVITSICSDGELHVNGRKLTWKPDGTHAIEEQQEVFIIPLLTLVTGSNNEHKGFHALVVQRSDTNKEQMLSEYISEDKHAN